MSDVVLSTHLDDAVLSCYALLSSAVTVVTVMAGVPARGFTGDWDVNEQGRDSHEIVLTRRLEDRDALSSTGCECVHLDLLDSQYFEPLGLGAPTREDFLRALDGVIDEARNVYAPAGIKNPDHKLLRDAALTLRPDAVLYADLPYALHPDWGGFELPPAADVPYGDRTREEIVLDDKLLEAKLASVRRYGIELPKLRLIFDDFVDRAGLGREVLWRP